MKPSFALSLSVDGIRLLHRAAGGWRSVGDVALDADDMAGELAVLRKTASDLEPGALHSKLLLPNEQIKYLTIDTPGFDMAARRAAAVLALDGATPYAVDDLVFDCSVAGDQTHIAAVAKETLEEAESFARDHRFNPVSFAAIPDDHSYVGEPFFGQTSDAATLLEAGEAVKPDTTAVKIVGSVTVPAGPVADAQKPVETVAQPEQPEPPQPETQKPAADTAAPTVPPAPAAAAETREQPAPKNEPVQAPQSVAEPATPVDATPAPAKTPTQPAPTVEKLTDAAPVVQAPAAPTPSVAVPTAPDLPPAPPSIGFASRRAPEAASATPKLDGVHRDSVSVPEGGVTAGHIDIEPERVAPAGVIAADAIAPPVAEAKTGFLSRRSPKTSPRKPEPAPTATSATSDTPEAERMTVFGARKSQVRGKPRFLGLILTAALLVFLAGVAAWASVFLDNGIGLSRLFGERAKPEVAEAAPAVEAPVADTNTGVQLAALETGLSEEDAAVLDALREEVQPVAEAPLSEAEIAANYATSGIWPLAPQVPPEPAGLINIDDLYLTSIDPVSTTTDAVALPDVASFGTDAVLAALSSPAAAGTAFALDDTGLVIATAAGALSPDGYTVYLGKPPLVPPVTPTRFQSTPEDTAVRDVLAAARPKPRPADLVENTERAQLDGLTRSELAGYRPALRPASLQQQAAAAAAPEDKPMVTDGAVALALAAPNPIENATRFAVRASVRPDVRPRNFSRIVKRAQRAKPQEPVRVASAASIAPRSVVPKVPSSASVAKQATVKNALNLRKVNLIGVYGKPSSRRALVRLGNGRYKKVVVGDRIDGGRVSAIGESELRYKKSGRNLVLKMPR
ncbi:hypothetical protein [Sulfitobacter geojensis]|uniref:hypothetical protein n=1 Tax=Sulfitobacter geojensis TaxID=1342299 RepID=UPI0007D9A13B|nr:hypothetical protein [Sulfitobacter geojensis]OAN95721.1 hypothetical protein A8B74_15385 [Sulfitobacter geojensis]